MADFGRPNATGRSSGKLTGKEGKARRPLRQMGAWTFLYKELLVSDAWTCMRPNTRRLIDFLLIEHCNHAGTENGNLMGTYTQLEDYGLSKNLITDAIDEAEFLGLILVERGGRWHITNRPNIFTLTWIPICDEFSPLNTWRPMTKEKHQKWRAQKSKIASLNKM